MTANVPSTQETPETDALQDNFGERQDWVMYDEVVEHARSLERRLRAAEARLAAPLPEEVAESIDDMYEYHGDWAASRGVDPNNEHHESRYSKAAALLERLAWQVQESAWAGGECSTCGFRYLAHKGRIVPCPLCELAAMKQSLDCSDDARMKAEREVERLSKDPGETFSRHPGCVYCMEAGTPVGDGEVCPKCGDRLPTKHERRLEAELAAFKGIDKLTVQERKGLLAVGEELIRLNAELARCKAAHKALAAMVPGGVGMEAGALAKSASGEKEGEEKSHGEDR